MTAVAPLPPVQPTTTGTPRVTIGVPVYNGAETIEAAIRPLLAQTFTDFELLISDNASTDDTQAVVERLARQDRRIRYVRQAENIGANGNYSFVAREARGEFLKWCSASDWVAPTFLAECVAMLDMRPDAVIVAPRTRLWTGTPTNFHECKGDVAILGDTPFERLQDMRWRLHRNNAFNGLIRLSALRRTRLVEPYMSGDMVLMGHLAMLGKFILLDSPLYYRRNDVSTSTSMQRLSQRMRHHYPRMSLRVLLQVWKQQVGWFRAGLSAPMSLGQRARVMGYMMRRFWEERVSLKEDLKIALRYAFRRKI
jgi:glycosyltransferase involved in cell wall biosynthesis